MILAVLEEFGRSGIEREGHVLSQPIAGFLDRLGDEGQCLIGGFQVGGEAALIADIGVVTGIVQALFQGREDFGTHPNRIRQRRGGDRLDHEFLNVDGIIGVLAAVQNVHHRHRQRARIGTADIAEQRHAQIVRRRLGDREGDAEDGVGTQARLVRRAVQIDHDIVDLHLLGRVHPADGVENLALDIAHGLQHALAAVAGLIAVAQLHSLIRAGRRTGRDRGAPHRAGIQHDLDLYGRVASAIENFAGDDVGDGGHDGLR